ncbi:MAG: transcription antitermination factor NusB [Oscillospiraceae bacterium]|nr:transcription antitermination factor NusB [Oscillospiraceae bacterium]
MDKQGNQKNGGRRLAREEAFKLLFQSSMHKDNIDELFDYALEENPQLEKSMEYIRSVVLGTIEKKDEIDGIISNNLHGGWKLSRVSKVPFYILELAVFEMKYVDDVPEKVAINEAVELAKKYSDKENTVFVNGVLSGVFKQLNV